MAEIKERFTKDQMRALGSARLQGGRRWKAMLRHAWETGDYSHYQPWDHAPLQQLRNASWFGPKGLIEFRP